MKVCQCLPVFANQNTLKILKPGHGIHPHWRDRKIPSPLNRALWLAETLQFSGSLAMKSCVPSENCLRPKTQLKDARLGRSEVEKIDWKNTYNSKPAKFELQCSQHLAWQGWQWLRCCRSDQKSVRERPTRNDEIVLNAGHIQKIVKPTWRNRQRKGERRTRSEVTKLLQSYCVISQWLWSTMNYWAQ